MTGFTLSIIIVASSHYSRDRRGIYLVGLIITVVAIIELFKVFIPSNVRNLIASQLTLMYTVCIQSSFSSATIDFRSPLCDQS